MFAIFRPIAAALLVLSICLLPLHAQSVGSGSVYDAGPSSNPTYSSSSPGSMAELPSAPEPELRGGDEHYDVAPAGTAYQAPFSRVGIGADVSPLGIGIKSATILTEYFDARINGYFFNFDSGHFEVDGFNADARLHLASASVSLDWYPFNSIWRLSPGLMFFNGNQLSFTSEIVPGTSFSLNGQTFYSASANAATGATPLKGTGVLGLHTHQPAFTLSGGFGKFIPRSNRHWSFPSEFGVIFMGAPTANVNPSGWACTDAEQTQCSNIGDPTNPVAIQFQSALQAQLKKWRKDLSSFELYPIFSYSVVYSFNIR